MLSNTIAVLDNPLLLLIAIHSRGDYDFQHLSLDFHFGNYGYSFDYCYCVNHHP